MTLAALPVAAASTLTWAADGLLGAVRAPGPAGVDQLVALGATAACGVALATVALGAMLTVLVALIRRLADCGSASGTSEHPPRSRLLGCVNGVDLLALSVTPGLVRRLAGIALGVSLVSAALVPAGAAASASPRTARHGAAVADADAMVDRPVRRGTERPVALAMAQVWSPDRPAGPRRRTATESGVHLVTTPPRGERPEDIVVVRRGDTLWGIAARALGPRATAREVASSWPRWHHTNRRTIGADPGVLRPGQRLRPPPALDRSASHASSPDPVTRKEAP